MLPDNAIKSYAKKLRLGICPLCPKHFIQPRIQHLLCPHRAPKSENIFIFISPCVKAEITPLLKNCYRSQATQETD